jgi:hypothetical protein
MDNEILVISLTIIFCVFIIVAMRVFLQFINSCDRRVQNFDYEDV